MLLLALLLMAGAGLAETGRVVTPKGPANMRKRPEDKAPLVESVPNRTLVDIEEMGEEWSRIRYKKQTGYVKTEFLRAPSQLVGQQAYPDGGTVLIRAAADESAPLIGVLGCAEKASITGAEGDWLLLNWHGETGYTLGVGFSYQLQEPSGDMEWISQAAVSFEDVVLRTEPKGKGEAAGKLPAGGKCTVTVIDGEYCLVETESVCGWAPMAGLCLTAADVWESAEGMTPIDACRVASEKLTQKYRNFFRERLYNTCAVLEEKNGYPGPLYHVGFFNDQNQYLYGALVSVEKGEAVFAARYEGFAAPRPEESQLLPQGEAEMTLSADEMDIGDVLDVSVRAWTAHAVRYDLYLDGKQLVQGEDSGHFQASYRPRQAGEYRLVATVKDENGLTAAAEAAFTVRDAYVVSEDQEDGGYPVYSQKDGWWKDKKYRHSNLGKSGCAIFALSHALVRLGHTEDSALPESLAQKYAYCLIPGEGTNNTLLINTAARDFGFTTKTELIHDKQRIAELLGRGCLFSFSPARGHIAMVSGISDDGEMIRVVDSAPGATFERITASAPYYQMRSGVFRAAVTLDDLPGARWYFETGEYGGLEYWMTMDYIAARGVRLIQPITAALEGKE